MEIVVTGSGKRIRERVKDLAHFAANKLIPRVKNVTVTINLIPYILLKENVHGDCSYDLDFKTNPRDFVIRVDSRMSLRDICIVTAHEMVHVKQFVKGELYDSKSAFNKTRWHGEWLNRDKLDYWDHPWEIEAHGREIGIFIQWCNERNYGRQQWTQIPVYPHSKE